MPLNIVRRYGQIPMRRLAVVAIPRVTDQDEEQPPCERKDHSAEQATNHDSPFAGPSVALLTLDQSKRLSRAARRAAHRSMCGIAPEH